MITIIFTWTSISESLLTCWWSYSISLFASSQAAPRPTTKGVGTVPLRKPLSFEVGGMKSVMPIWRAPVRHHFELAQPSPLVFSSRKELPPPDNSEIANKLEDKEFFTLGPYILCPEIDIKSIFILLTSTGIFPTAYAEVGMILHLRKF